MRHLVIAMTVILLQAAVAAHAAERFLVLATTTSTENSGLLAYLHPDFEARTGIRVKVVAKGTGVSLQLGRDGNADVVLVHAREEEDRFMAEGHGIVRRDVMYNDFILLGPADDPAGVQGVKSPVEAFQRIAAAARPFVSRGDSSGTHLREQALWRKTKRELQTQTTTAVVEGQQKTFQSVRPRGAWYLSIGQGMGKAITAATEKRAYTLADRGTYYAMALAQPPRTDLAILCEGDGSLRNPYGVIAVSPQKHPGVHYAGAKKYVEWITSPETQRKIGDFKLQGKVLFFPSASRE